MPAWRNGRRKGLKIPYPERDVRVRVPPPAEFMCLSHSKLNRNLSKSIAFSVSFGQLAQVFLLSYALQDKVQREFPLAVKAGSSVVKIYRDRRRSGDYFGLAFYLGGKRHRLNFNSLDAAKKEAAAKAAQLARGDVDAVQLTGRDRLIYGRALDAIKPLGVLLDAAAAEYAQAAKTLAGHSLLDAVDFYMRHRANGIAGRMEADAIEELRRLLAAASFRIASCLAIQAFAGVRTAELLRLTWHNLERRPGYIEITAKQAKTAARRLIPISQNLANWLREAPRNGTERFWTRSSNRYFEGQKLAALRAGMAWKANALRHAFISYRVALTKDIAAVALEAGNSPKMFSRIIGSYAPRPKPPTGSRSCRSKGQRKTSSS